MTILTKALSAIGLMRVSEHEREIEVLKDILEETRAAELLYLNKFKKAVTDLEQVVRANETMASGNALLTREVASLRPDAQKWRDSLKRSRDRKAAKKGSTPPARDKRAKNRGGGK